VKIDLHAHTIFSDGVDTPERMVARAKAVGLDGIAITDHDSVAGWKRGVDAGNRLGINVITGKEMRIRVGDKEVGEILALFIDEDITLNQRSDLGEIMDRIKKQDGIAAIPHPFDWWRKTSLLERIFEDNLNVDAIEVINGRNRMESNIKSIEFADKNGLSHIAGSDSHRAEDLGEVYTFCDTNDIEAFRKMIKKRKSIAIGSTKGFSEILKERAVCKLESFFKHLLTSESTKIY